MNLLIQNIIVKLSALSCIFQLSPVQISHILSPNLPNSTAISIHKYRAAKHILRFLKASRTTRFTTLPSSISQHSTASETPGMPPILMTENPIAAAFSSLLTAAAPTIINTDSDSALDRVKNNVKHPGTKHIDIRHHFIRSIYQTDVDIRHVPAAAETADILTKAPGSYKAPRSCTAPQSRFTASQSLDIKATPPPTFAIFNISSLCRFGRYITHSSAATASPLSLGSRI